MGGRYSKQKHKPKITKQQIPWLLRGAIRSNNVETLQYLLSYPNDVDPSMVIGGICPLNLAIEVGHVQMVKILIKAGANIHVPDAPRYPLLQAALFGRCEISEILLKSGCNVNIKNERHESALHLLVGQNSERFILTAQLLLNSDIDPNCLDENGLAPLHKASPEIARVIALCDKADLNLCSSDGDTPLTAAIKDRRHGFVTSLIKAASEADQKAAIAAALLAHSNSQQNHNNNANNGNTNNQQNSPSNTRYSVRSTCSSSASSSSNQSSRKHRILPRLRVNSSSLTRHSKSTINNSSNNGTSDKTPNRNSLNAAELTTIAGASNSSRKGSGSLKDRSVSKSISHGSFNQESTQSSLNINQRSSELSVPERVIANNHIIPPPSTPINNLNNHLTNTVTVTTATNSNINATNPSGQSLLRHLVVNPPIRLNLEKADKIGMSPLMIAADAGQAGFSMVTALVGSGAELMTTDKMGMSALHYACYVGCLMSVQFLFEVSVERGLQMIDIQDKFGRSLIYLATCRGHGSVVDYLLAKGADLFLPNKELKSPLYIAANFGHLEIVNALLRNGAQVDQADSHNKTPLYVATYHGRSEIVDLLLRSSASVNMSDKNGRTPLYIAVLHGHLHIASRLIDSGASVNRPDVNGFAPLHMAVKFPKLDFPMVKLLLSNGCDPLNLSNFTNWLLNNNIISEDIIQRDVELYQWLKRDEFHVRSLKRLCRNEVQKSLGHTDSLKHKIDELKLPPNLKTYLSMKAL